MNEIQDVGSNASDYRRSHLAKSIDYDRVFYEQPHTSMLWDLERRTLDGIVDRFFPIEPPRHLDFATGTGRVLRHLSGRVSTSTGVDVSDAMLSVAREACPSAEIVQADLTREGPFEGREFDLITAFRFFPNAQPSLRDEAMQALAGLLSTRGVLVINNHLNSTASSRRLLRVLRRDTGHLMTATEVAQLASAHGLRQVDAIGLGVLPLTDQHFILPAFSSAVETALMVTPPGKQQFAHDVIYVFSLAEPSRPHPGLDPS